MRQLKHPLPLQPGELACPTDVHRWQRPAEGAAPGELGFPAQPKLDLGHPFAARARIAQWLPVGEVVLIKELFIKSLDRGEEEVIIS